MAFAEALARIDLPIPANSLQERFRIPAALRARLERTGEMISPRALEAQARAWKRCTECDDLGTLGSAIDRTLAFCACMAGIEAIYRDGADWCERETARVHADAKSLLVAATDSPHGGSYLSIQLSESLVEDDGAKITIRPPNEMTRRCLELDRPGIQRALGRLGWTREVRIKRPEAA